MPDVIADFLLFMPAILPFSIRLYPLDFIAPEISHYTAEYSWWLGWLCEFSTITKAAKFTLTNEMTFWRRDFEKMRRMFQHYKIPKVKRISVDEVFRRNQKFAKLDLIKEKLLTFFEAKDELEGGCILADIGI